MNVPPPSITRLLQDLSELVNEEDQTHPLSEIFRRFENVDWKTENLGNAGEALLLSAKLLRLRALAIENPNLLTTERLLDIFENFTRTQSDYSGLNKLTYQGIVRPRGRLPGKSGKGFYRTDPNILDEWLHPKASEPMPTTIEEIQELAYEERMAEEVERLVAFIKQPHTILWRTLSLRTDALHVPKTCVNFLYWHKAMRTSHSFNTRQAGKKDYYPKRK